MKMLSGRLMRALGETDGASARKHVKRILKKHRRHPNDRTYDRILEIIREDNPELLGTDARQPAAA